MSFSVTYISRTFTLILIFITTKNYYHAEELFYFLMFYFLSGINAFKNDPSRASEGQRNGSVGKALAAKADSPLSISRTYRMESENWLLKTQKTEQNKRILNLSN